MSRTASNGVSGGLPGEELGVIDSLGMGWRFLKSDFWKLWLVGLVLLLLLMVSGFVPFGQFIAGPPLVAGFFYVLMRRIDGHEHKLGEVFEGFRQRFGQSIVAVLPVLIVYAVMAVAQVVAYIAFVLPVIMMAEGGEEPDVAGLLAVLGPGMAIAGLFGLAVMVVQMFFIFAFITVWEYPQSGWEAAKASMRMVRERFWSVLGFMLLAWVIATVANLVGLIACYVGMFFTAPVVMVWIGAAIVFLYRSWTGRPLVEELGASAAPPPPPPPPQA